jgi:hypothetical protein
MTAALSLRQRDVLPFFQPLLISNDSPSDGMPMLCMVFDNDLLYSEWSHLSDDMGQGLDSAVISSDLSQSVSHSLPCNSIEILL